MNDRNQRLQRTGKESRKRALTGVLYVTAIPYFVIQWKFASRIGPNKIFSASRKTDQVDFAVMIDSMSNASRRECNTGNLNTLLFNDSEIAVPYIETKGDIFFGHRISPGWKPVVASCAWDCGGRIYLDRFRNTSQGGCTPSR